MKKTVWVLVSIFFFIQTGHAGCDFSSVEEVSKRIGSNPVNKFGKLSESDDLYFYSEDSCGNIGCDIFGITQVTRDCYVESLAIKGRVIEVQKDRTVLLMISDREKRESKIKKFKFSKNLNQYDEVP